MINQPTIEQLIDEITLQNRDFPRKCVTAYNPTRRISNDRQQIKRFSHANGQ